MAVNPQLRLILFYVEFEVGPQRTAKEPHAIELAGIVTQEPDIGRRGGSQQMHVADVLAIEFVISWNVNDRYFWKLPHRPLDAL